MKKFSVFPLLAALALFVSCQKQQTEEERKAEVERQVQDRLAAERLEAEKQNVAKQQADLAAREQALAEREAASPTPVEAPATAETEQVVTETSDGGSHAEAQSTAAYGMFYEKLDPYGEWRETSDYGYVWQPREAETSRDWRPYTEGRWVYSDAGWTWVSDEKFGWATYHYGRWVKLRRVGWVWVPGDEWAPAWVSWRTSKDYVGWAPLPPEARFDRKSGIQNWADSYYDIGPDQYSFVASNDFGAEHVRRSVVPAERNTNIVIETTNVTRITFSNAMIMNEGPSYDELRSRGPRPIERYRLRRERNTEMQARISGTELEVSVPVLSEVRNIFRPRRVKERVTEVNVDNGWTSVSDRSAADRARTKIRAEATPPPNAPPKKFVPPAETAASSTPAATVAATPRAVVPSATPTRAATPTPAPTTATSAIPSPVVSASPRTRPSPSLRPRPSPSPTTASTASSTPAPTVSTTPRTRPSPSIPVRISPTPLPAASAAMTTPPPTVSTTPRTRPSPSIPARISPTPLPAASAAITTPPMIPRRTLPPVSTTPAPTIPPSAATESSVKPVPTIPPVKRSPIPPRPMPTPTVAPETSEAARPPVPREIPRRTIPPRLTPPPAASPVATPTVAPAAPAATDERQKNRRPPRPAPGATESGTPTPAPSAAPQ